MRSDIAFGQRAKNRVDYGVCEHIGIRMALSAKRGKDRNAADDERTPFNQTMRIATDADAEHNDDRAPRVNRERNAEYLSNHRSNRSLRALPLYRPWMIDGIKNG
jgi:hypothetical protein